ncbi:MAG TPA: hypothetical protein VGY96_04115 [Streptosporangiaceae bacterium]|nr:hypothetical protein [Streptosporangiaceae bacterium]
MVAAAGAAVVLGAGSAFAVGGWTIVAAPPTGQNATFTGVATVSDSDAWAVGYRSGAAFTNVGAKVLIDNWTGTAWSQVAVPATPGNTALLLGVSASSATDAWAVGRTQLNKSDFEPVALHWNGTAWSVSPGFATAISIISGASAVGVADISAGDAYAIGNSAATAVGSLAHWNGTAWSPVTLPLPAHANSNTTLNAISADGPDDVWIVGTFLDSANGQNETFSEHFNGTAWSVVPMPLVNSSNINAFFQFNGIKANSASDVWAVGDSGVVDVPGSKTLIEHFNGTAWSIVPSPSPGSIAILSGVTTSNAANSVWAVGADTPAGTSARQTLTLDWNGTTWNVVASPNTGSTDGVGAVATNPGAAIVWAVGESGPAGSFNPLVLQNG